MNQITIRKACFSDLKELQFVSRQTFYESFADRNTEENMNSFLAEQYATEKLMKELSDPESTFFLAILESRIIGYLKINIGNSQTELRNENALEIERIYVLKEFQGKTVGKLLFNIALQTARNINADFLWLGVWEENIKAIQFYRKNGLVEFHKHLFTLGEDIQTDLMMKLKLK